MKPHFMPACLVVGAPCQSLAPRPGPSNTGPPTPTVQAGQAKSDKDTTICKGRWSVARAAPVCVGYGPASRRSDARR